MQVPAPFAYERATSVEHALDLLAQHGPEARVVAGGHSLIPLMKLRLASPDVLIDINDLTDLSFLRVDGDELTIGAMTRHADLLASAVAGEHFPLFHDAERVIADPIVRNWGTVGGSLCHADPAEDLAAVFAAVHAMAVIRGHTGAYGTGPRIPQWILRDRGRAGGATRRAARADPSRRGQCVREGGAPRWGLAHRRRGCRHLAVRRRGGWRS